MAQLGAVRSPAGSPALAGIGQRRGAAPAVLGDVEQHALRAVELLFEIAGLMTLLPLVDVMLGAEAFELLSRIPRHPRPECRNGECPR